MCNKVITIYLRAQRVSTTFSLKFTFVCIFTRTTRFKFGFRSCHYTSPVPHRSILLHFRVDSRQKGLVFAWQHMRQQSRVLFEKNPEWFCRDNRPAVYLRKTFKHKKIIEIKTHREYTVSRENRLIDICAHRVPGSTLFRFTESFFYRAWQTLFFPI